MRPIETDKDTPSTSEENSKSVEADKNDNIQDAQSECDSTSSTNVIDLTFEPTVEMMVNDFDEEATLEEEEALASSEKVDPSIELNELKMESEMPLEDLLALYKYTPPMHTKPVSRKHRKRRHSLEKVTTSVVAAPTTTNDVIEVVVVSEEKTTVQDVVEVEVENKMPKIDEPSSPAGPFLKDEVIEIEDSIDGEDGTVQQSEDEEEYPLTRLYPESFPKSTSSQQLSDEEDDCDYSPDEHDFKKTIMVGGDYQAIIPTGLSKYDDALPYENDDKLLWDPSKVEDLTVENYLKTTAKITNSQAAASPTKASATIASDASETTATFLRDDEQALYLLLQCGHNVDEAIRRKQINSIPPTTNMSLWSEEECRNFESGIRVLGKDFHLIQKMKVKTRSVGELVQFYYLWKKTARHDAFANRTKLEKRKLNVCVNAADHMDRFLEDQDGNSSSSAILNGSTDRSKSPVSTSSSSPTFEPTAYSANNSLLLARRCGSTSMVGASATGGGNTVVATLSNGGSDQNGCNNNYYLGNSPLKKMKQRASATTTGLDASEARRHNKANSKRLAFTF